MARINYCLRCGEGLSGGNCEGFCSRCLAECACENQKQEDKQDEE